MHVLTLGLRAHFGLATPPAVHLPAARTLSPGVQVAWMAKERKRIEISVLISNPKQEENSEKKTDGELDEG